MKKLVFREKEFSFYLFNPDFFHLYDKEKKGRCEPVHRYTLTHILHQYVYLIGGGYQIFYCEKNNEIVSYVIYTRCRRHVFSSGNKNDYYIIFYYTYPEYRGNGYANILMEALFRYVDDNNDFYECIAISNFASIRAAEKIGFRKDGFVKKSKILHILSRVKESSTLLYKYDRNINSLGLGKVRYKE